MDLSYGWTRRSLGLAEDVAQGRDGVDDDIVATVLPSPLYSLDLLERLAVLLGEPSRLAGLGIIELSR